MKAKEFKPSRPYIIIGAGNEMTLLTLGNVYIERDISSIVFGGPPQKSPAKQYVWHPQGTGKITIYDVTEGVEEIHVQSKDSLSIYQYDEKTNSISYLFRNITAIEELPNGDSLIQKGDKYYFNGMQDEKYLGEKIADNLYLDEDDKYYQEDKIISGDFFRFGCGPCRLRSVEGKNSIIETMGNDCIINDKYILLRKKDFEFFIHSKDGKVVEDPEVKTDILGLPVIFKTDKGTSFGGVTGIKSIKTPEDDGWSWAARLIKTHVEIEVVGENKTEVFYYMLKENKVLTKDELYTERQKVNDHVEIYKKFDKWYSFDSTTNEEKELGEKDEKGRFIKRFDKAPKSFFGNSHLISFIKDSEINERTYSGVTTVINEEGCEFQIIEMEPFTFYISKKSEGDEKINEITDKKVYLKVKKTLRLFEYQEDKNYYILSE